MENSEYTEDSAYNDQVLLYDEMHGIIKKWENKLNDITACMFESAELKMPKKYIENDQLRAVFDAVNKENERIILYEECKCYCLTYDYFLDYFKIQSVPDKKPPKKCSLQ